MKRQEKSPSLETLSKDIEQLQAKVMRPKSVTRGASSVQGGLELVSGTLVGAGLGYVLDTWLGTLPVFFIICFFLGAGGGFLTLYRHTQGVSNMSADEPNKADTEQ